MWGCLYGFPDRVQSPRRLESACDRKLTPIWRSGRLKPDFKTIADFCNDNGLTIRKVCQQIVDLCRDILLPGGDLVPIDGNSIKAIKAKGSANSFHASKMIMMLTGRLTSQQ